MTTEIIGYIAQQQTAQKPTETPTVTRKIKPIHITNATKSKLLGALLIVLGAITIPICDNDATAFVMCFFLGLAAIIGGDNNE